MFYEIINFLQFYYYKIFKNSLVTTLKIKSKYNTKMDLNFHIGIKL